MSPFRRLPTIFTNCVSLITAYSAGSQTPSADGKSAWPTAKVIKLVVGYPPGGGIDFTARTIQAPLAEALKPQVVVDYKPRASGMLAATELNRTAADGYTLLVANTGPFAIAPYMLKQQPYDPLRQSTYIGQISQASFVVAVKKDHVPKDLKEFIT